MFHSNVVFALLVVWSTVECGFIGSRKPWESKDEDSGLDCSRFHDDFDVLRQLPIPIAIYPNISDDNRLSTAYLSDDETFVYHFSVRNVNPVPLEVFCLSKMTVLYIEDSILENDTLPDALGNLKELKTFYIHSTPMKKITKQLTELIHLRSIQFINCSLTSLPNMSNLRNLTILQATQNNLTRLDELPAVLFLSLGKNLFTEIPILQYPDALIYLVISKNPLKSASPLLMYKNLRTIFAESATLTSIPRDIDQLQKLDYLDISANPITTLPMTLLNLPRLEVFNATELLLPFEEIVSMKRAFKKSRPSTELFI